MAVNCLNMSKKQVITKLPKEKPVSKLILELDKEFSIFIRKRAADKNGIAKCFTCGKMNYWQKMDCGHYVSRTYYGTRWDEKNCQCQCKRCNIFSEGKKDVFAVRLQEKYGNDILFLLQAKKNNSVKLLKFELQTIIGVYKEKNN